MNDVGEKFEAEFIVWTLYFDRIQLINHFSTIDHFVDMNAIGSLRETFSKEPLDFRSFFVPFQVKHSQLSDSKL